MSDDSTCCALAEFADPAFFKALGHDNRVRLLEELCNCREPMSVGELSECCDVDLSVVSRHLSKLRDAGVIESEKDERSVKYSICVEDVVSLLRAMADAIEASAQGESNRMEDDDDRIGDGE